MLVQTTQQNLQKNVADLIVENKGGNGALRDLAEIIIEAKKLKKDKK